jgi:hypothetical protein
LRNYSGTPSPAPSTVHEFVSQLDAGFHHAIGHFSFPPDPSGLLNDYWESRLVIASNGWVTPSSATQGWVLLGTHSNQRPQGHGFVPGGGQKISSFCLETGGYVVAMVAIDALLSTSPSFPPSPTSLDSSPSVTVLINNKTLIHHIGYSPPKSVSSSLLPEFDLLQVATSICTLPPNTVSNFPHNILRVIKMTAKNMLIFHGRQN